MMWRAKYFFTAACAVVWAGSCSDSNPPAMGTGQVMAGTDDAGMPTEGPCDIDNGGCNELTTCSVENGEPVCAACPEGYEDVNGDGTRCVDIDECDAAEDDCDETAACTNTPGSFACECQRGYEGDGVNCADIDECESNNGGCGVGIPCQNTAGAHLCGDCPQGYTGMLPDCTDLDECENRNGGCDRLTACTNAESSGESPTCGPCPAGYTGTGAAGCLDVDECQISNGGCGTLVACQNTIGGHLCGSCPEGYTGDSPDCRDIDECEIDNGGCDALTSCVNPPNPADPAICGSCPAGYSGTSRAGCSDVDECLINNGGCDALASCTNALVPGGLPICGVPRPAIDRLEPARNPANSVVLVVGTNISQDTTREIRVGGLVLAASAIQWPPAEDRFRGMVAIRIPAIPAATIADIQIVNDGGSSNPAPLEVLTDFPPGPWPPESYVFPVQPDVLTIPVVTVDPLAESAPSAPPFRYDFVEQIGDTDNPLLACNAVFSGTECVDPFGTNTSGTREQCTFFPLLGVPIDGTCLALDDVFVPVLTYATDTCCVGGDPSVPGCETGGTVVPCTGTDCLSCDTFKFVPCNPFTGSWDMSRNAIELTVERGSQLVRYSGECTADEADALPRPCRDPILRDPEGRQLMLGTGLVSSDTCN